MGKLRVAIQMDDIASIKPRGDSTLALGIEAIARGHEVFYYTPDKLTYRDGAITARVHSIKFFDDIEHYYELGDALTLDLKMVDVVLLRQDPPFDMMYLTTTYLLEQLSPNVLVVNDPANVRNNPEKLFPTLLHQFMPPTLITADKVEIEAFRSQHKDIILKPLYGFGGRDIIHIKPDEKNANVLMDEMLGLRSLPIVVQKFLPEVASEDRRIILIDGEIGGVFGRTPAAGDFRANMAVGGTPVAATLTAKQHEICEALKKPLKEKGLIFVGLDCIGDYLTEINITSPTGLRAYKNLTGEMLEKKIWDAIEAKR